MRGASYDIKYNEEEEHYEVLEYTWNPSAEDKLEKSVNTLGIMFDSDLAELLVGVMDGRYSINGKYVGE